MNTLSKLIIFFIFLFLSILSGLTGKDNNNIIKNKLFLFTGVFIFQFILNLIDEYKKRNRYRTIKLNDILIDSVQVSAMAIIGYSVYVDLLLMPSTHNFIKPYIGNKVKNSASISCVILFFVSVFILFKKIITS
ncbi:hypothetical protein CPAV1605_776 [seawater metagenome]|uniref:Uncharacterized protein n=1 Tax=seawater metagenome TaxID=1561972 RepID=A0A5E8CIL2_9ZZZZ